MQVRILGAHCIEAQGLRMSSILIDDILALDAGGLTAGLSQLEQEKIRAVFLTHHHFDHSRDLITLAASCGWFSDPVKAEQKAVELDPDNVLFKKKLEAFRERIDDSGS